MARDTGVRITGLRETIRDLERLGVSFDTLHKFKQGQITPQQFEEALAPGLDASQYGGDVQAWVKQQANFDRIMSLLTLANPITALVRKLVEMGVPFDTLKALKSGSITDAEFEAQLPGGLDRALFGGNVAQWLRDNFNALRDDCDVEDLEFCYGKSHFWLMIIIFVNTRVPPVQYLCQLFTWVSLYGQCFCNRQNLQ